MSHLPCGKQCGLVIVRHFIHQEDVAANRCLGAWNPCQDCVRNFFNSVLELQVVSSWLRIGIPAQVYWGVNEDPGLVVRPVEEVGVENLDVGADWTTASDGPENFVSNAES